MTKGGSKAKFVWVKSQQQVFEEVNKHLCLVPVLTLPDLQHPIKIETNALDYVVGVVLTRQGHLVVYDNENLLDASYKYPTYENMYSIVKDCCWWKHYIIEKEMTIHTNQKPMLFMQAQG